MAQEALALHIQGMIEDGDPLPAPSKLEDIMADGDYADAAAYLQDNTCPGPAPPLIRPRPHHAPPCLKIGRENADDGEDGTAMR